MQSNEISNRMKILVMYAGTYDMPAKDGQDAMKGCTVQYYFFGENGEQLSPVQNWDIQEAVGVQRNKVSLEYAMRAKIHTAPGLYYGDFQMVTGGDGKPVMKLRDIVFVEPFEVSKALSKPGKEAASPAASK